MCTAIIAIFCYTHVFKHAHHHNPQQSIEIEPLLPLNYEIQSDFSTAFLPNKMFTAIIWYYH